MESNLKIAKIWIEQVVAVLELVPHEFSHLHPHQPVIKALYEDTFVFGQLPPLDDFVQFLLVIVFNSGHLFLNFLICEPFFAHKVLEVFQQPRRVMNLCRDRPCLVHFVFELTLPHLIAPVVEVFADVTVEQLGGNHLEPFVFLLIFLGVSKEPVEVDFEEISSILQNFVSYFAHCLSLSIPFYLVLSPSIGLNVFKCFHYGFVSEEFLQVRN